MTMKYFLVSLCLASSISSALGDGNAERQLYTECRENGIYVPLSSSCCRETSDIQFLMASSFVSDLTGDTDTCDQVNFEDLMDNFGTYCQVEEESHHNSHTLCTYNVRDDNSDCFKSHRDSCEAMGGYLFQSDVLLECEEFNPIILVRNSLSCLGASCNDRDVQEYLWAAAATNHAGLGPCTITRIGGQTYDSFKRKEASVKTGVVLVLVFAILVFGVGWKVVVASRQRTELMRSRRAKQTTNNLKPIQEELSPLKTAKTVSEEDEDEGDCDSPAGTSNQGEFA